MAWVMTNSQSWKIDLKSFVKVSFNSAAWLCKRVFLLKSNTSSLKSFKIFSVFSHFAWDVLAVWQISVMKFFHETSHSCLTIDTSVTLSFVIRWFWVFWCSSSDICSTNWIMHYRIPYFCSSGKIFHRVCKNKSWTLKNKINLHWLPHQESGEQGTWSEDSNSHWGSCRHTSKHLGCFWTRLEVDWQQSSIWRELNDMIERDWNKIEQTIIIVTNENEGSTLTSY